MVYLKIFYLYLYVCIYKARYIFHFCIDLLCVNVRMHVSGLALLLHM